MSCPDCQRYVSLRVPRTWRKSRARPLLVQRGEELLPPIGRRTLRPLGSWRIQIFPLWTKAKRIDGLAAWPWTGTRRISS